MKDRAYHRKYSREYYHLRKAEMIAKLGGVCIECGSTEDLQFDHISRDSKSFSISKLLNYSKHKVDDELNKCQLLCKNCHKKKSAQEIHLDYISGKSWFGEKAIRCIETGQIWSSIGKASRETNIPGSVISNILHGKRTDVRGYHFEFI